MNKERITEIIESAINEGIVRYSQYSPFNPDSFASIYYRNTHAWSQDGFVNTFIEEISKEEEIEYLSSCVFVVDGVMEPLSIQDIAEWLLAKSLQEGTSAAIDRLRTVVNERRIPYLEVLAICGITPFEPTPLTDDIVWIPFDQVSPSPTKDFLTGIPTFYSRIPELSPYPEPASAIIRYGSFDARIIHTSDLVEADSVGRARRAKQRLDDLLEISRCLTLFGAPSTPVMCWVQPHDWNAVPGMKFMDARDYLNSEIIPKHHVSVGGGDYKLLISRYISLHKSLKEKLRVPIERLDLALRRQSSADQAVELGIALESLLIDRDSNSSISYLLRLRGALLVGTTLKQRVDYMRTLRDLYSLRSSVVHSGKVKDERKAENILRQSTALCERMIRMIIEKGAFPAWDELTLTAGKDWHIEKDE